MRRTRQITQIPKAEVAPFRSELEAANLYQVYRMGWKHGATGRSKDPDAAGHSNHCMVAAYELGYMAGGLAFTQATHFAMDHFGYDPGPGGGILRA